VPQAVVTDNGTHFNAALIKQWLKSIGSQIVYTSPRHPQSNGLAENFVRTLKTAIRTCAPESFDKLDLCIDNFLLQYRNAEHTTTHKTPAFLFKGRNLRTSLSFQTTEVYFKKGNDLRLTQGIIVRPLGSVMFEIVDPQDGSVHRRHLDQIQISKHFQEEKNEDELFIPPLNDSSSEDDENKVEDVPSQIGQDITFQPNAKNASTPMKEAVKKRKKKDDSKIKATKIRPKRQRRPPDRFHP